MGRLEHLKQTLPQNLADNAAYPNCQFVVLNYGGEADTEQWIKDNFSTEIKSGRLKYVSYPAAQYFHLSHAKNMSHRMADGEIVCNIDADQFTGKEFAQYLADNFVKDGHLRDRIVLRHCNLTGNNTSQRSSLGKIALRRKDFEVSGGYDEKFNGWGGEDTNLLSRMTLKGMRFLIIPWSYASGIEHSEDARIENYPSKVQSEAKKRITLLHDDKQSRISAVVGKVMRVGGHMFNHVFSEGVNTEGFGMGTVYVNFSKQPVKLGPIQKDGRVL